ncbi:unnamed protein product [Rotaria sp. Silwood2]|nr:unnamed protein product [Rotaria sp. Silwood2]CAF2747557.1 unnamed protein product [Rotaria sp. Silwood2]CAF3354380.1 unnamed protein product [Rotaria sp. Silwood2]CAF4190382.1 unnamed protein product [Rotaria sp. Silwood2]CAF4297331.1 unnamed protein product [Rotaria sp. Silwood2]
MNAVYNIVARDPNTQIYTLYRRRFYVLAIFSFLSFNQCAFWITFSPISPSTQIFYGISSSTVDYLLNWGPIVFIPCLPLAYLLLNRKNGFRLIMIITTIISIVATLVRIIPLIFISPSHPQFRTISVLFLHVGQILNAACGPLVMAPVSQLSCLWFSPNERTRATTVAIMVNTFGATISFLINPSIVARPTNIPYLLYFHFALALLVAIPALIYFPAEPPTAPSAAAELLMGGKENNTDSGLKAYIKGLQQCATNRSFVLLVTVGGLMTGTFGLWTGLFSTILAFENYSEKQAGKFRRFLFLGLLYLDMHGFM